MSTSHCHLWENLWGLEGRGEGRTTSPRAWLTVKDGTRCSPQGCSTRSGPQHGLGVSGGHGGHVSEPGRTQREKRHLQQHTRARLELFQGRHWRTALPQLGWQNNEKIKAKHRGRQGPVSEGGCALSTPADPHRPPAPGIPRPRPGNPQRARPGEAPPGERGQPCPPSPPTSHPRHRRP